jgi:RNA recognition motif-containing protein
LSSDDDSLLRARRRPRDKPREVKLPLPSPSESPGPESPSLPKLGSTVEKRPRVLLPLREPRSPRGRRRQGSPDSLNSNSPESSPRYVLLYSFIISIADDQTTIFVGNLPFTVDDEALAEIFTNLSIKVKSAKVIMGTRKPRDADKTFKGSKGFGFVEVEDPAQQQEAVDKVAGTLIGDRAISAKVANEMRPVEEKAVEAVVDEQA